MKLEVIHAYMCNDVCDLALVQLLFVKRAQSPSAQKSLDFRMPYFSNIFRTREKIVNLRLQQYDARPLSLYLFQITS